MSGDSSLGIGIGLALKSYGRGFRGLLNQYPGAAASYSLRKLSSAVSNVVRARRASDNAEQDFTAADVSNGTLESFCGVGDGFVETWYDQSGNGNDAAQSVATKQPKIVDAGVLVSGGLGFDGVDDLLRNSNNLGTTSNFFISCVATLPDSIANQTILSNGTGFLSSGDSWFLKRRSGLDNALAFQDSSPRALGSSAISETQGIFTAESNGTNLKIYANGSEQDSVSTYTAVLNGTTIGARIDEVSHLTGQINEVIIYPSDQSANRVGIEANINAHYNIY
jgi:hypothetical protein